MGGVRVRTAWNHHLAAPFAGDSCISRILVVSGSPVVVDRAAIEAVVSAVSALTLQDVIVADNSPANRTLVFQSRSFRAKYAIAVIMPTWLEVRVRFGVDPLSVAAAALARLLRKPRGAAAAPRSGRRDAFGFLNKADGTIRRG
ncbi:hypothetical protein B0T26DRAFT_747956 [Lasiosphaeria miniovina]|uniref:Uncharacterized protein n=1 Tax=Lasiosphaeria miniovina TaxID=1954250 RepID=A0AA40B4Q9_9PEZI|nr:uncharacterized protein B0T26DRAFT_747956 [Lasiosphaeria miniovina]KAK0727650.1 hypothetical protein B0T26DRAFT_747956 [Lasiosphaeria miniovina]